MSDNELAAIREKKLRELQEKLSARDRQTATSDSDELLNRVFKDRAWEEFNDASTQFPQVMGKIKDMLTKLVASGKLTEVTGEELYFFLRKLGLRVRLNTKINYASHGQLKSLEEKMKETLAKT